MPIGTGNTRSQYPMQASAAVVVAANADTTLSATTTQIFISHNNTWTCTVVTENGDDVVLAGNAGNVVIPLRITRVKASTIALNIVALF